MKITAAFIAALPALAFALPAPQEVGPPPEYGPGKRQEIASPPDFGPGKLARSPQKTPGIAGDIISPPDFGPGRARRQLEDDSTVYSDPAGGMPPSHFPPRDAQEVGVPPDFGPGRKRQEAGAPPDFGPGRARRQLENESPEFSDPAGVIPPFDPARRSAQEIGTPPDFGPGRARRQEVGIPPDFGPGKAAPLTSSVHPKPTGISPHWAPMNSTVPVKDDKDCDEHKPKSAISTGPPHGRPTGFFDVKPWGHGPIKVEQLTKTMPRWPGPFGEGRPSHTGFVRPSDWPLVPMPRITPTTSTRLSEYTGPVHKKHVETESTTTRTWFETVTRSPVPTDATQGEPFPWVLTKTVCSVPLSSLFLSILMTK